MCGLIGVINSETASVNTVEGLYAEQNRGREAAGIASADGMGVHLQGGVGLVEDVFHVGRDVPRELPGMLAIGHVRYSTVSKDARNSAVYQPIRGIYGREQFCLAHNGNLTNVAELKRRLGIPPEESIIDTELVVRLIEASHTGSLKEDLVRVFESLEGSYSFLILFRDRMIAVRDPSGCRPLTIGGNDHLLAFASETAAFGPMNARKIGTVEPGTIVEAGQSRDYATTRFAPAREKKCAFEPVYFSLHTGVTFGIPLLDFRMRLGVALEEECRAPADIVLGVPDSAVVIADGYGRSGRSGTCIRALTRHHHAGGRTFILPSQDKREATVRRKFQFAESAIEGKRVALIDDSIVRGTTMRCLIERLRRAGATAVHVRSAFPPIRYSCPYGIDTPRRSRLIAASRTVEETCAFIGADSLAYMSEETLLKVLGGNPASWCRACHNGEYWHNETVT